MGKFDGVLDEVYGKQNTKLTSVLDEIYGPAVEPVTMEENAPTPIAEEGYVPPAGITDALRVAPGLALDATGQMISGAIQQAQEVAPSMINRAYERFVNADLGGVLPPEMRQKVAPIINIPQEDINAIAAVGQQAEENIKSKLQEARIQPGLNAPNIVANAASSVIQQAPIFAGAMLGGPIAGMAGLAALGLGSMGQRYTEARRAGYTPEEATLESGLFALAEVVPEKLGMDAIFAAAKNPAAKAGLIEGIKRIAVAAGLSMPAEALEEGATQLAQNTIRKYARPNSERITEKPVESIAEGVPEAAVTGAVAGGAIGGGLGALQSMLGQQQAPPPTEQEAPKEEVKPEEPMRETPTATEPAPQNMEQTTEFLTRKPTITIGEAERLQGEAIPEGRGGMTIGPRRPAVTFGGEGERKIAEQPEKTKAIEARPITEVGIKEDTELPPNVWLHGSKREPGTIKNFTVATDSGTMYLTRDWDTARAYADNRPNHIKVVEMNPKAKIFDLNDDAQAENLAKIIREANEDYSDLTGEELQKMDFNEAGLSDNREIGNILYDANVDAVLDTNGHADIINDNALKTYNPKGMTIQPTAPTNKLDQLFKREQPTTSPQPQQATEVAPKDITPQPAELAVKTPEVKEPSNVEIARQNFNRIMNAQPYELTLEDYIYQKQQKARVYRKPTGQKDRQEMKSRVREVGDQYAPDEHKNAVKAALAEGKPVPPEVLAEYPELNEPRPKSGPGMFGGATVQNMYEEIAPKVKKGLDIFTKKAKEFIADEEGFYSPEELANAVKAVKDKFIGKIKRGQSTQVTNTINTYAKILDRIADKAQGKTGDVRVVDVSTGLGMSEELAKNLNYKKYETTEPFPAEGFVPTYKDSTQLPDNAFDFITNNQVLNVVPKEIRDGIVKDIGRALKEGGTAIISTRGKDVMAATTGRAGEEPMSLYIPAKDAQGKSYEQYQKGFTNAELKDYVQGLLGDGFDIKTAPFGAAGVEIVKTKKTTPKIGMLGAGTLQNAYEKVEPTLKKGADMLFKKGKQAYETVKRNADLTRDVGRVIDITEKEGRPVETEPPIRPRIGLFNLQNVYESVFGKPRQSDNRITIGDPKIGTKINNMYDRTEATRKNLDEQAEKKRPTTYATTKQSMIDVFMPYLDIVKNDSARYEQALSKLHDVFYIPSAVEGFLLDLRDEILTPVQKAGKTYRDYSAYRMAKWTLTGRAKVKSPLPLKEAQDFIDSIDAPTKKLFEDITTKFHERVWKNVLKEVEATGLKDDKTINFIMDKENYATFFPAKQMGLSYGSREYKPSGEIFKLTEEGYTGDIQDVLTSLTQKGIAMITHANINAAKLEAFDILKTYSPGDITPAKQSMKGYTKIKDSNGNEIEIPIMEFDEPAPNSQMALLTARDKGKAVGYYVPKQFATSFDEALGSGEQLHDALRYFSNATQAIKNVWIDYNPPWQLFTNIVRDIPAAMIEMPGFKKPVKFAGKVIRNAPAAIGDYIPVIGKALQIMTGYDRAKFDAQVKKMLKEKKLLSSKDVQQLGDYNISVFDRIQNAFDTFPREGESKKFLQQVKAFGKDVERLVKTAFDETLVESQEFTDDEIVNMTRRGGSPAFAVRGGGKAFNVATTGLVFYNAVKEGWRAGKYFYQKDPVGFVIKASIPLSIFSFGVAAVSGAFGDEWKKAYLAIKKSDRENKLTFPLWWEPDGQVKYIALSMPQFLKPFMTAINEFGSADARILEGMADAFSNEIPSLNPVFDIAKTLALYGQNKPPIDRFGNPIMTQDQWTAGGPDKAINMLKAISNQNLFGSIYRFPIKPSEAKKDLFSLTSLYDATFGKILKTSFAPAMDTEKEEANAAKARLLMRQAIEVEKSDPVKYQKLRDEIRKLGVVPSRQFMRSVRRNLNIEREEEAGTITKREAYEKKLRSQPKEKRKKYNELFRK